MTRRSTLTFVFGIGLGIGLFALLLGVGFAAGLWFATNYSIVPKGSPQALQGTVNPEVTYPPAGSSDLSLNPTPPETQRSIFSPPASPATSPLGFHFKPQERLDYRVTSQVTGQGFESIGPSDIRLGMDGDISMVTDRVDNSGNADLTISYDRMQMTGDFMGSSYSLDKSPGRTVVNLDGKTRVDTQDPSRPGKGIPQLEFLEDPLKVKVAPTGQVLSVAGGAGWGEQLKELPVVMPLELPQSELRNGSEWDSDFTFPVAGAGAPVKAHAHNVVEGYQYVGNRLCAVIRQEFDSKAAGGQLNSPESVFGKEVTFGMPLFDLEGTNYIYFDTQRGQLVHTASDLKLTMKIGTALGEVGDIFEQALSDLNAVLEGTPRESRPAEDKSEMQGLDLVLDIDSTMTLSGVDPTQIPAPAPQGSW